MTRTASATRPRVIPDFSCYANVMTKRDMAAVFGRSVRWVELHVARGTFPIPRLTWMRDAPGWNKARVQRFFEDETFEPLERSVSP
jgi:hypothetical protein